MKIDQRALAPPDRSSLRKMSLKITMIIQIQITNMKNQSIDQSTWPVPHSAAIITVCHLSSSSSSMTIVNRG